MHTKLQRCTCTQSDRGSVHMKCHITKMCLSFQTRVRFFFKERVVEMCLSRSDYECTQTQKVSQVYMEDVRQGERANIRP